MKIIITKTSGGPGGTFQEGCLYDIPNAQAQGLIDAFAAEPLEAVEAEAKARKAAKVKVGDTVRRVM